MDLSGVKGTHHTTCIQVLSPRTEPLTLCFLLTFLKYTQIFCVYSEILSSEMGSPPADCWRGLWHGVLTGLGLPSVPADVMCVFS